MLSFQLERPPSNRRRVSRNLPVSDACGLLSRGTWPIPITRGPATSSGGYDLLTLKKPAQRLGVSQRFLRRQWTRHHLIGCQVRTGCCASTVQTLDEIVALAAVRLVPSLGGRAMSKTASPTRQCRVRNRSVPPPPPFDPSALPDNALLTAKELAGWLRLSLSTFEDWRLRHPDRGPSIVSVAAMPRYRMSDVRKWLLSDRATVGGHSASRPASMSSSPPASEHCLWISLFGHEGHQSMRDPRAERIIAGLGGSVFGQSDYKP